MHTVLIADDEPWVVYRIREMIEWERLGYIVIGEAHNGLSALEIILEKKPDVVISDIRMPGLNGIELLEQIRFHDLRSNVIMISGYSEFEYAQKALRFGAFDYLLKQVDKIKLTDALERLKATLEEKQKVQKGLEMLLGDLFEIFESDENIKLQNFLSSRGMDCEYPHFRFISCLYPHSSFPDAGETQPISGIRYLRFRTGQNKVSFLINYDELKYPTGLLDFISDHLSDARCIGISGIGVYSTPVAKLYQESDIALCSYFTRPESRILEYKQADHASALMGKILQIEVAVKEQKPEQVNRLLDELSVECKERSMQIDQLCTLYNQIVLLSYKYYSSTDADYEIEYMSYDQMFRQYRSVEELFGKLKAIFRQQTGEELHISNERVQKIINFIDANIAEDIMLVDLSKKFHITVGYVSALMKKETGKTYMEYVMNKRLNLAKELLQDTSLSIQEIVERVGYRDYFHFNKIFKKVFGITPGKFRKL